MTVQNLNEDVDLIGLLSHMVEADASDLYICEGKQPAMRVHGSVNTIDVRPTTKQQLMTLLDKSADRHLEGSIRAQW